MSILNNAPVTSTLQARHECINGLKGTDYGICPQTKLSEFTVPKRWPCIKMKTSTQEFDLLWLHG